ncbi:MAG: HlyD family efflux transporter periplasmic adaptor subunit [Acutalibacter sp.]
MNSKKIRTIGAVLLAVLVLVYVGYQGYLATHRSIQTETAMYGQVSDVLQAQSFIIRNEQVIDESANGVLSYRVADGTRVAQGGVIADVFSTEEDASAQRTIEQLDEEIANLQALSQPADYFVANPSMLADQIYSAMEDVALGVNQNSFSQLTTWKESLLSALTRRQLITGEESAENLSQRISQLESQRSSLESQAGDSIGTISAPQAGYFISSVDGLESAVDVEDVENLTVAQVEELLSRDATRDSSAVGKICQDFNWYVACVFDEDDMVHLEGVDSVYLDIPFASTEQIPATVVARNYDKDSGDTAVVFQCSYMDSDIAAVRNEAVQVTVATYSGVLVNERALRFEDVEYTTTDEGGNTVTQVAENVRGVYVLYGGQLEFVQVFTDHSVNGYAICKTELSSEEQEALVTSSTIQLYDQVVVEGTDLYDGKVVS